MLTLKKQKVKEYTFTLDEIHAIRYALDCAWFGGPLEGWSRRTPTQPIFQRVKEATRPLLNQFKDDVFNM